MPNTYVISLKAWTKAGSGLLSFSFKNISTLPQIVWFVNSHSTIWILFLHIMISHLPSIYTPTHARLISFLFQSPGFQTLASGFSLHQIFCIWNPQCQDFKKFNSKFSAVEREQIQKWILNLSINSCMMWIILTSVCVLHSSEEWS